MTARPRPDVGDQHVVTAAVPALDLPAEDPHGLHHLPYGVFSGSGTSGRRRLGIRVGDHVLDVAALGRRTHARWAEQVETVGDRALNELLAAGPGAWRAVRRGVQTLLADPDRVAEVRPHLHPLTAVRLHLPLEVGDYVDFYASEHHATNVGRIFRPDGEPLTPNWKHLPIGYHGRSSTIVVSGTDVVRPWGQRRAPGAAVPVLAPSDRLDIEAEVAFVLAGATEPGTPVSVEDAGDHLFGIALFNDWSARDIQAWEYVPLGPFLGKSFASSLGAWITPMEALAPARVPVPGQDPPPLPYLTPGAGARGLDLTLEVEVNGTVVARPPYRAMYWSPEQMLAHLTVNGAAVRDGDLFASGTVSGPRPGERGSLLELTWNGTEPLRLDDGSALGFLRDGDTVTIRGRAPGPDGVPLDLGEVSGTIRPARTR